MQLKFMFKGQLHFDGKPCSNRAGFLYILLIQSVLNLISHVAHYKMNVPRGALLWSFGQRWKDWGKCDRVGTGYQPRGSLAWPRWSVPPLGSTATCGQHTPKGDLS